MKNSTLAPYSQDLLNFCSEIIIEENKDFLPNLSAITVLLPSKIPQVQLQNNLLSHADKYKHSAILLPNCTTLRQWALTRYTINKPLLSQYARELVLVDAIGQQPNLFKNSNSWAIASELLTLFDEMALNNIDISNFDNYANNIQSELISKTLSQEAELVTTLWQAWQDQISNANVLDATDVYIQALQNSEPPTHERFYCIGLDKLSTHEIHALNKLEKNNRLHIFLSVSGPALLTQADIAITKLVDIQNQEHFESKSELSPYSMFFDALFSRSDTSIKERADEYSKTHTASPIDSHLKIFKTASLEQHVKAIDIKIRISIYQGKQNIGVITSDRKLVRRLRAVLEHANILVNDLGGWALATTSSAALIENWIKLIEDSFSSKLLISLVKSPFFPTTVDQSLHNEAIDYLEKEVVLRHNIHGGSNAIRKKLEQLHDNSSDTHEPIFNYLYQLLDKLEVSTRTIVKLYAIKQQPIHRYFEELLNSLKAFGIYSVINKDDAGKQIIEFFIKQISHFKNIDNKLSWAEWRRFLARVLDQQNYKPPKIESNVTFCSLEQSRLLNFDSLIIASVDKEHFPGSSNNYVFFNQHIRSELNIPTWKDEHALHLYLFRRLLQAAPDILITVQTEQNGENITPSPWLESIETFHKMAYGKSLEDEELHSLVAKESTSIIQVSDIPMPKTMQQPMPILRKKLKPNSISISDYQDLINCPYKFFASACLKISKTKELKEDIDKVDFGSLVHKCIHAFFSKVPSMPGPFNETVTTENRASAEAMLRLISENVFNQATEYKFSDKLWLQRWLNLIPSFIDWEINRQKQFTPHKHEVSSNIDMTNDLTIKGRIDRIDQFADGYAIIDYKTGHTVTQKEVQAGEKVQLPMYAFLYEDCNQVEYVSIGENNAVKSKSIIKDDQLSNLVHEHHKRLTEFVNALSNEPQLPAFADDDICKWCEFRGLCRKDYWDT